jgi:hypothetical protein
MVGARVNRKRGTPICCWPDRDPHQVHSAEKRAIAMLLDMQKSTQLRWTVSPPE